MRLDLVVFSKFWSSLGPMPIGLKLSLMALITVRSALSFVHNALISVCFRFNNRAHDSYSKSDGYETHRTQFESDRHRTQAAPVLEELFTKMNRVRRFTWTRYYVPLLV